jgi:hypothetical protein
MWGTNLSVMVQTKTERNVYVSKFPNNWGHRHAILRIEIENVII